MKFNSECGESLKHSAQEGCGGLVAKIGQRLIDIKKTGLVQESSIDLKCQPHSCQMVYSDFSLLWSYANATPVDQVSQLLLKIVHLSREKYNHNMVECRRKFKDAHQNFMS